MSRDAEDRQTGVSGAREMRRGRAERRRYPRAPVMGFALALVDGGEAGLFVINNLSASGALLLGEPPVGSARPFRLLLHVPGRTAAIGLEAAVVRRADGAQPSFAVRFLQVSPSLQDLLQQTVLRNLARQRRNLVLVIDALGEDTARLVRDLERSGYESALAATPLEAMTWLAAAASLRAVLVSAALGDTASRLLGFVASEYPDVRRILLAPRGMQTEDVSGTSFAEAVVAAPYSPHSLADALGATL